MFLNRGRRRKKKNTGKANSNKLVNQRGRENTQADARGYGLQSKGWKSEQLVVVMKWGNSHGAKGLSK